MDHDYELEEEYAPRILWGRLAFFLLALLLAFVAGRACAPSGVPQDDFQAVQEEASELAAEKAQLQQRLDAQEDTTPATGGDKKGGGKNNGGGDAEAEATEEPTEEAKDSIGEGQEYEVQAGDTLYGLAEKFYGDTDKYTLIADANNLDLSTDLVVGQVLVIPPDD